MFTSFVGVTQLEGLAVGLLFGLGGTGLVQISFWNRLSTLVPRKAPTAYNALWVSRSPPATPPPRRPANPVAGVGRPTRKKDDSVTAVASHS